MQGELGKQGEQGEPGEKGEKGEAGQKGEQGLKGEPGEKGEKGEQGEKGETGSVASPSSLFRRSTFEFAGVENDKTSSIATADFIPAISGTALVSARGYCNINGSLTEQNEIDLKLGKTEEEAEVTALTDWGVIRLNETAPSEQALGFTAETEIPVTKGESESVSLFAIGLGEGEVRTAPEALLSTPFSDF